VQIADPMTAPSRRRAEHPAVAADGVTLRADEHAAVAALVAAGPRI